MKRGIVSQLNINRIEIHMVYYFVVSHLNNKFTVSSHSILCCEQKERLRVINLSLTMPKRVNWEIKIIFFETNILLSIMEKQVIICQIECVYYLNAICFKGKQNCLFRVLFLPIGYHLELTTNHRSERHYLEMILLTRRLRGPMAPLFLAPAYG